MIDVQLFEQVSGKEKHIRDVKLDVIPRVGESLYVNIRDGQSVRHYSSYVVARVDYALTVDRPNCQLPEYSTVVQIVVRKWE